jgi:hypothetical protein
MCLFRCFNEITNERSPVGGLRPHSDRPRRRRAAEQRDELATSDHSITSSARASRPAEQRDELAAIHSITSSARASNVGGTVRPSARAVMRLISPVSSGFTFARWRLDCLAGHVGLEPANPSASYLIGIP